MSDKEINNARPTLTALPCSLEITELEVDNAKQLPTLLAQTFGESTIAGIVWTTNGTRSINGLDPASAGKEATLNVASPDGFDMARVYEARIWRVIDANRDDATLAHEFRWVNGVGAVELKVTAGTDSSQSSISKGAGDGGWAHAMQYLQHVPSNRTTANSGADSTDKESDQSGGGTGASRMTAVEFIQEEDKYGNTIVIDQLFTGKWN